MNKQQRIIWREASPNLGCYVLKPLVMSLWAAGLVYAAGPAPNQLPTGGQVVAGQASIAQSGAAALNVNQTSASAVVNWNTFNLGSAASVNFAQPSSASATLNRVLDSNPSQIYGRISAPGQVFFTNPNGIYFGKSASVDVGALTATTHSISNADFMAGNYRFSRDGASASVVNDAELKASLGGYIALLAPEVRNQGVIVAQMGTVALAAGEVFELQMQGTQLSGLRVAPSTIRALVDNALAVQAPGGLIILSAQALNQLQGGVVNTSGALQANALVQRNGRIVLDASDKINVSGQIQANSDTGKGGEITLTAAHIALQTGAQLQATGARGGGTVLVGGDWQGSNGVRQATTVTMQAGASVDASATQSGDGGKVVLWSDIHSKDSRTDVNGSLSAKGGATGGDGGNIETSGAILQIGSGVRVDTSAGAGKTGNWLLDPIDFTIAAGSAGQSTSGIGADTLSSNLATSNVSITTDASTAGNGDIFVSSAISKASGSATTLTLNAARNIALDAGISSTVGALGLTLNAGGAISGAGNLALLGGAATFTQATAGTYSGVISGTGTSLVKAGAGTLTLSGTNTYTGATTVSAGTLQIGDGTTGSISSSSAVSVASGATLALNQAASTTFSNAVTNNGTVSSIQSGQLTASGVISGTGALTKSGAGLTYLTRINTYTGGTTISAGNINLFGSGSIESSSGVTLSGSGAFSIGSVTPSGATIKSLSGASTTAPGVFLGTKTLTLSNASGSYAGEIRGTGGSLALTAGSQTLTGTNSYTVSTTVNGGTLQIGDGTAGSTLSSSAVSVASGATLNLNLATGTTLTSALTNNGTVNFIQSGSLGITGVISGAGALTQSGTGATLLSGINTYTGGTSISDGQLSLYGAGSLESSSGVTLSGSGIFAIGSLTTSGATIKSFSGTSTLTGGASGVFLGAKTLTLSNANGSYSGVIGGTGGGLTLTAGSQTLTGVNSYTGATTVNGGTLQIGDGTTGTIGTSNGVSVASGATLAINMANTSTLTNDVANNGTLNLIQSGSLGITGVISGTGAVTQTGTGSSTLRSVNTYTGDTSISNGSLLLTTGSMETSSGVTMSGAGVLGISGTTSGATIKSLAGSSSAATGVTLGAKTLTLSNANGSYAGVIGGSGGLTLSAGSQTLTGSNTYTGATTLSAGTLVISNNTPSTASSLFSGPGNLVIQPTSTSFTSAFSTSGWNFDSVTRLGGLTLGKSGNTAAITVANATTVAGPVSLFGGNIAINGALTATSDTITLTSAGNVTQAAALTASNLSLSGGNVSLSNTSNAIGTLAATGVSDLSFVDNNALIVGTVGSTNGISATGAVTISTVSGNLNVAQAINTSSTSSSALTLNAGSSTSAGTSTGGDVIASGSGAASVGAGGTGKVYTGSVSGSTGLAALVGGSGSGRFRYGSDESASNYTLALSTGLNAIYREQPTITRSVDSQTITYGGALPTYTFTASGGSNGDTSANIWGSSTAPTVAVGGSTSNAGNYIAGPHTLLGSGGATTSPLGYAITNSSTAGTLTVSTKAITISGITAANKVYDATNTANLGGTASVTALGSDVVTLGGTGAGTFANKNVGTGKAVTVSGYTISGADAGNYTLVQQPGLSADITPKAITISGITAANKEYDGGTSATVITTNASGWLAGDTVTVATTGTFSDKNVGTGKTVSLRSSYSGLDAGNYSFTDQASTTADITPASSTLTPAIESKIYDGSLSYTYTMPRLQNTACSNLLNPAEWASRSVGGCR